MVDNRSAGFFGIGGSFNFKGGDISGTAAKSQDDKMGSDAMYANLRRDGEEEEVQQSPYMDRSAALRATLNSLAMMNVANVINSRKRELTLDEKEEQEKKEQNKKENKNNKENNEETPVIQAIEEHLIGDEFDEDFDFAGELED
jgi:hypothetical protein